MCTSGPACVVDVSAGELHSCAVYAGRIKCWGGNGDGQLGLGDQRDRGAYMDELGDQLLAVNLGSGQTAAAVAAGGRHTCALLDGGGIKCWGNNAVGQLGLGDRRSRILAADLGDQLPFVDLGAGRKAKAISAGLWHTCVVLDDGTVKCWGDNRMGQLGLGDIVNRGDDPGEMGDNLPAVDLGVSAPVIQLATGAFHTCALLGSRELKCWGWNDVGELGLADAHGRAPGQMGVQLPSVNLRRGVASMAVGAFHSCAIFDGTADVKCWGLNRSGQLGQGVTTDSIGPSSDSTPPLPSVDLGSGRRATSLSLGATHSCALLDDQAVRCWGYNFDGELGIGSTDNRGRALADMGDNLPETRVSGAVRSIAAGANHTCAVSANQVYCWGLNTRGQLGTGDDANRGDKSKPLTPVDLGH